MLLIDVPDSNELEIHPFKKPKTKSKERIDAKREQREMEISTEVYKATIFISKKPLTNKEKIARKRDVLKLAQPPKEGE